MWGGRPGLPTTWGGRPWAHSAHGREGTWIFRRRHSGNSRKSDVRVELQQLQMQLAQSDGIDERVRLAWPQRIVQLIERNDRALRHPWHEILQRHLGRLVQVEIQKEEAHDQVGMIRDESGNRLGGIAFDELDLGDVTEESVPVVHLDQSLQLGVRIRAKGSWRAGLPARSRPALSVAGSASSDPLQPVHTP